MKIRISLPENRDYAGRLEVLDARGSVVFGPVPAAGRAHDEPARANGNASRSRLRPYGDTPLGTYVARCVILPAADDTLYTGAVLLLEPSSGEAALADAHGRFRLLVHGNGDDDGALRATAGGIRVHDRSWKQIVALMRALPRVSCQIISTFEEGAKVSSAESPLDRDPPVVPGRAYVSMGVSAPSATGSRSTRYQPRMFVVPETSGSSGGGTAYGAEGGTENTGGETGVPTAPAAPDGTTDGPLPVTGVDVAPTPGIDINPPPDQTTVTSTESGASQLLSTAAPGGLPSPYSSAQTGWITSSSPSDPYSSTAATATDNPLAPFTGTDATPYSGAQAAAGSANPYTGGQSVDPSTGTQGNQSDATPVSAPQANGGSAASGVPDTPATPIGPTSWTQTIGGQTYTVSIVQDGPETVVGDGDSPNASTATQSADTTPGTYAPQRDTISDPDAAIQEMVQRFAQYDAQLAASQSGQGQPDTSPDATPISATAPNSTSPSLQSPSYTPGPGQPDASVSTSVSQSSADNAPWNPLVPGSPSSAGTGFPTPGSPIAGNGTSGSQASGPTAAGFLSPGVPNLPPAIPNSIVPANAALTQFAPPGYQFVPSPTVQSFQIPAVELPSLDVAVRASGYPVPATGYPVPYHAPVDPNPLEQGFFATNPSSTATPGEHALGDLGQQVRETVDGVEYRYTVNDSPFIAMSTNVEQAAFGDYPFQGERYLVNLEGLDQSTIVRNDAAIASVRDYASANAATAPSLPARADAYAANQPVEQEIFARGSVPPDAVSPLSDAKTFLQAETETAPSTASTVLADLGNAGLGLLKFAGEALSLYGAYTMASRNADEFSNSGVINQGGIFLGTFLWTAAAGVVDDGLAALTIEIGSAPVLDSWDQNGAGPTQVLVGDALQSYYRWAATVTW